MKSTRRVLSEDQIFGFIVVSTIFGGGVGTVFYHFVPEIHLCGGMAAVSGVTTLLLSLWAATK
jgi:hypothetical protein